VSNAGQDERHALAAGGVVPLEPVALDDGGGAVATVAPHDAQDGGGRVAHAGQPRRHHGRDVRPRGQVQGDVPETVPCVIRDREPTQGPAAVQGRAVRVDVPDALQVAVPGCPEGEIVIALRALLKRAAQALEVAALRGMPCLL
jgi:hypothetical protein